MVNNMSSIKRRKVMIMAVIIAAAVFTASALVAGAGFSGYERLKNAGFQFIEEFDNENGAYSNGMFWTRIALYVDGEAIIHRETADMRDGERGLTQESEYYGLEALDDTMLFGYSSDSNTVTYYDNDVIYRWYDDWNNKGIFSERPQYRRSFSNYIDDSERISPAQRQLIEAVADALIGDTRNYFISDGDVISISLSGNQIPQIAQYAVAALAERVDSDPIIYGDGAEGGFRFGADARFSNGKLEIALDENNNVTSAYISFEIVSTIDGRLQSFRMTAEFLTKHMSAITITKPDGNAYGKPILPSYDDDGAAVVTYANDVAVA